MLERMAESLRATDGITGATVEKRAFRHRANAARLYVIGHKEDPSAAAAMAVLATSFAMRHLQADYRYGYWREAFHISLEIADTGGEIDVTGEGYTDESPNAA